MARNRQSMDFHKTTTSMAKSTAQSILATSYTSTGRKKGNSSPPRSNPMMLARISEERSRPLLNYDEIKNSGLSTAENIISTVNFENVRDIEEGK